MYDAIEQAQREAKPIDDGEGFCGRIPVVAHRRNDAPWLAILRLDDFLAILSETDLVREPTIADALAAIDGKIVEAESAP